MTNQQIAHIAKNFGLTFAQLKAFVTVESGGKGFDDKTGKLIIQFEPSWFKRKAPYTPSGLWSLNKVDVQAKEWEAFNNAFKLNPNAAMESTSIGLMQVMGFHYKNLGFRDVGDMWDFAKVDEVNQLILGIRFVQLNHKLLNALKNNDWRTVAYFYNGEQYEKFNYHNRMADAHAKALLIKF